MTRADGVGEVTSCRRRDEITGKRVQTSVRAFSQLLWCKKRDRKNPQTKNKTITTGSVLNFFLVYYRRLLFYIQRHVFAKY